jgi:hypothetical protein
MCEAHQGRVRQQPTCDNRLKLLVRPALSVVPLLPGARRTYITKFGDEDITVALRRSAVRWDR